MGTSTTTLERELAAARGELEITAAAIHLNHAGVSPLPRRAARAVADWAEDAGRHGPAHLNGWFARVERARENHGRLLGVPPADLAFTRSTSHALLLVANTLPWQSGDNVVLAACEFPANGYQWRSLAWRGVETRTVQARADGRLAIDDYARLIDRRTRVVAASWVQFSNGFRQDLGRLSELCQARGALLVVDLIQGLGALPLELPRLGVRVAAGAAHKWLMAPQGLGWLYCHPEVISTLVPGCAGWLSVAEPFDFFNHDLGRLRPDARRFEESGPTVVAAHGLEASTSLLLEVGAARIAAQLRALTDQLVDGLGRAGHRVTSPRGANEWSGIVTFVPRAGGAAAMVERLAAAGVTVVVRGDAVRLSPHFYNTADELAHVLEVSSGDG